MDTFENYLQESKIKDMINKVKRKLKGSTFDVAQKVLTKVGLTGAITIATISHFAEKMGIELEAQEIHHILHTLEEIGHNAIHLVASNEIDSENYIED